MSNFIHPRIQEFDVNGNPLIGGRYYFYVTGTTTPQNTYADQALTTPNTNPIVADASGRFPVIWLDPELAYKVVLQTSAGVTIYTADPVMHATTPTADAAVASPLDFGAMGDGVANDADALQAALDSDARTIDLGGRRYRTDASLAMGVKRLINGVLDFSQCTEPNLLDIVGTLGDAMFLSGDAAAGATQITVTSTASLSAGDWLLMGGTNTWATGITAGELVRIKTVSSGTIVILETRLRDSYTTSNAASARRVGMLLGASVERVGIIGAQNTDQVGIHVQYNANFSATGVDVSGVSHVGVQLVTCANSQVTGLNARDIVNGSTAQAVSIVNACYNINIAGLTATDCGQGVVLGGSVGVNRDVRVHDIGISGARVSGVYLGAASQQCSLSDAVITMGHGVDNDGVINYGDGNAVSSVQVRHASRYGLVMQPQRSSSISISGETDGRTFLCAGNTVHFSGSDGILISSASASINNATLSNNDIVSPGGSGVRVALADNGASDLIISNTHVTSPGSDGVKITTTGAAVLENYAITTAVVSGLTGTQKGVQLDGGNANSILSGAVSGITVDGGIAVWVDNVRHLDISGIVSNTATDAAIVLMSADAVSVSGVSLYDGSSHGVYALNCTNTVVNGSNIVSPGGTGVHVEHTTNATVDGVAVTNTRVSAAGNRGICISSNGGGTFACPTITGNQITNCATDGIRIEVDASTQILDYSIVGNQVLLPGGHAVHIDSVSSQANYGLISSNTLRLDEDSSNACVAFTGTGNHVGVLVTANITRDGAYGVRDTSSGTRTIQVGGNYMRSHSVASISGLSSLSYGEAALINVSDAIAGDVAESSTKNLANLTGL